MELIRRSHPWISNLLRRSWHHQSDYFHWDHVGLGCYKTLDGQIHLTKGVYHHKPSGWYLHIDIPNSRCGVFAGHARREAFHFADEWAAHRIDFFIEHFHV